MLFEKSNVIEIALRHGCCIGKRPRPWVLWDSYKDWKIWYVVRGCSIFLDPAGGGGEKEGRGGGGRRVLQIFQKNIRSPGDHKTWPSNFFRKYVMVPPINFSFLFKAYLGQFFRVVVTVIFKFQITKEVNIHNNIQKIIFK